MLIETARRAEAAAKEMLALVDEGSVSCAEMREALAVSKAITVVNSAFQTGAAASIAVRESHGDGGAEVLAGVAGLSRRDAHSQVKAARIIESAPSVRDAVESGRVSLANARRLAEAVDKTSAEDVQGDKQLLARAESMRPEQFAKEARRWTAERQGDGGENEYRRQRARRCVRVWDADDGMVHLHGQFDAATGRRIGNRLQSEARRLYSTDKKITQDGQHTLHPPDPVSYGPARASEHPPPLFRPDTTDLSDPPPALFEPDTATPPPDGPQEKQPDGTARCGPSTDGAPDSASAGSPLTRPGPTTARAALHNARSKRNGPPRSHSPTTHE